MHLPKFQCLMETTDAASILSQQSSEINHNTSRIMCHYSLFLGLCVRPVSFIFCTLQGQATSHQDNLNHNCNLQTSKA